MEQSGVNGGADVGGAGVGKGDNGLGWYLCFLRLS